MMGRLRIAEELLYKYLYTLQQVHLDVWAYRIRHKGTDVNSLNGLCRKRWCPLRARRRTSELVSSIRVECQALFLTIWDYRLSGL